MSLLAEVLKMVCSMMLLALKQPVLSADTRIFLPEWVGWQHWWKPRRETDLMYLIPFIFSAGGAPTVSKGLVLGRVGWLLLLRGYQKAISNSCAAPRKCVP